MEIRDIWNIFRNSEEIIKTAARLYLKWRNDYKFYQNSNYYSEELRKVFPVKFDIRKSDFAITCEGVDGWVRIYVELHKDKIMFSHVFIDR